MSTCTNPPKRYFGVKVEDCPRHRLITSDGLWDVIKTCWKSTPECRNTAYALAAELRKLGIDSRQESGYSTDHSQRTDGSTEESFDQTVGDASRSAFETLHRGFSPSPGQFPKLVDFLYVHRTVSDSTRRQPLLTNDSGNYDTPTRKRPRRVDDLTPGADDETPTRKRIRSGDAVTGDPSPTLARSERRNPLHSAKRSPGKKFLDYTKKIFRKALHPKQPLPKPLASTSTAIAENQGSIAQRSAINTEEFGNMDVGSASTSHMAKRKRLGDEESAEPSASRGTKKFRNWRTRR